MVKNGIDLVGAVTVLKYSARIVSELLHSFESPDMTVHVSARFHHLQILTHFLHFSQYFTWFRERCQNLIICMHSEPLTKHCKIQ